MSSLRVVYRNTRGFTLIELVLVLVFIGLIAGLTTPFVMSTLDRVTHQAEAREIASALRYARSEAITRKTVLAFNGDIESGEYWLAHADASRSSNVRNLDSRFRMVRVTSNEERVDNGTFAVKFYPMGNSSGGIVRIEKHPLEKSNTAYAISIDPVTGSSKIEQKTR